MEFKTAVVNGVTISYPAGPLPNEARAAVLEAAFNKVKNPEHWKLPVDATVVVMTNGELADILEAIEFYTATEATAVAVEPTLYRFTAPGYYAGPAN